MIFHSKKVIFIHIAKTAGESTEVWLGRKQDINAEICDYDIGFGHCHKENIYLQHATASTLKTLYPNHFDEYYKFAIVRNPYNRMVSSYRFGRDSLKCLSCSFEEFVMKLPELNTKIDDFHGCPIKGSHYTSMYDHTHINGKLVCNIIKFETLPTGLPIQYGDGTFPKLHESTSYDVLEYTEKMRNIVRHVYHKDFVTFNYEV